jgi:hypothetical protein
MKRKHVFRRQKRESGTSISSDEAALSDGGSVSQITSASGLEADSRVSDFIDLSFWKRKEICCGTIFVGPSGEAIVDPRLLRSCPRQHKPKPLPQLPYSIHTIETMIATELKLLDRKDRKDVVCPLTPSTTSSDSSSPSSSEEGGAEEMMGASFSINHKSSSVIINSSNTADGSPPSKPMINAITNNYLVF